jgi:glucokinase
MDSNQKEKSRRVFAADLGGTHLRSAIVDEEGSISSRSKQRTPAARHPQEIVELLVAAARESQNQNYGFDFISVVIPGAVNVSAGKIVSVPNISCLDGFNLVEALSTALDRPAILENDANAAAAGEMWQGAARGRRTIVCLTLGTGVGGGIILDGRLWHGVSDAAAEVGHMCVEPFSKVLCGCGNYGCLEAYASGTAIVRMAREGLSQHPESTLNQAGDLTSEKIFAAGKQGDALAVEVFQRMGFYLGIGIANLVDILNPETIVIGGGVANGWDLFAADMRRAVREHVFPRSSAEVEIVTAACGDDAGLLGAAKLAFAAARNQPAGSV